MRKYRRQGDHGAPGETRREILFFLLDYPNGASEDAVREYMYRVMSIRDRRSVRNQLEKLKEDGEVIKRPDGWAVNPFDRESFFEFWINLDFETKLRLLPKEAVQNHMTDTIYPEFIDKIRYDPQGFSDRLNRLKLEGAPRRDRPLSEQEETIIRTAFLTIPTMVDFQLGLRPEIDIAAFDLIGHLVRLHPEKKDRFFTPGFFGLLYILIARNFFLQELPQSSILPYEVIDDWHYWLCVPFMEKFQGVVIEDDLNEIDRILHVIGEFIPPARPEGQTQKEASTPARKKWATLAQAWPGRCRLRAMGV